jgi:hypothetical protein
MRVVAWSVGFIGYINYTRMPKCELPPSEPQAKLVPVPFGR